MKYKKIPSSKKRNNRVSRTRNKTKGFVKSGEAKFRLPRLYAWKTLGWLTDDLRPFLSDDEYALIRKITRLRDFPAYTALSEAWGLQSITSCVDTSVASLRAKYQLATLLKKFRFPTDKETRLQAAKDTFFKAEQQCFAFNQKGWRNLSVANDDFMLGVNTYALAFIRKVIGDEVPHELLVEWSRHGPGSTLDTKNGRVSNYYKFESWPYDCTSSAFPHAVSLIQGDERWLGALENSYRERNKIPPHMILNQNTFWASVFNIVEENKITFVPKSAHTERTIAIEPTLNLYLQLGVDGYMRRRLKRWNIDLDCQARNQELARLGSINGSLATIDLSSASDTISERLVRQLLPPSWYSYLSDLRAKFGWQGEDLISYEKFSSMGNGYTFALESLLFTAITYAVNRQLKAHKFSASKFAIYGDDIIVPTDIAHKVVEALQNCGFTINTEKSYLLGPVRESCGADWFMGKNVRPVFFSEEPRTLPDLFVDINRLKRVLELYYGITESKVVTHLTCMVPTAFKNVQGPYSDEDFSSYLHASFFEAVCFVNKPFLNCTWKFPRLVKVGVNTRGRTDFYFRKLMHTLKPSPPPPNYQAASIVSAGSRFLIRDRNQFRVKLTYSETSHWSSSYTSLSPSGPSLLGMERG